MGKKEEHLKNLCVWHRNVENRIETFFIAQLTSAMFIRVKRGIELSNKNTIERSIDFLIISIERAGSIRWWKSLAECVMPLNQY